MRFHAKKNAGYPKAPRDFPPRKDGNLLPASSRESPPPLQESVRTNGRTYADLRTNIFRIDRLLNFLTHGPLLCGLRTQRSSAIIMSTYLIVRKYENRTSLECCKRERRPTISQNLLLPFHSPFNKKDLPDKRKKNCFNRISFAEETKHPPVNTQ